MTTFSGFATGARRALMWPVWTAQIFTGRKSFKENPVLGSRRLNQAGLHVARVRGAQSMARWRWFLLSGLAPAEQRESFRRDGFLLIENYLPRQLFERVKSEVKGCQSPVRECIQGDTLTLRVLLDDEALAKLPAVRELVRDRSFVNLLRYCAGTLRRPMFFIQCIKNKYLEGREDPQKALHSDTFHPTMKCWLFLDDVEPNSGAFMFVPGSAVMTDARLAWERDTSLAASGLQNRYAAKGSLRVGPKALKGMGLPPAREFSAKANTLVIANTNGFHCRGPVAEKCSRIEIYGSSRVNPFNPFPGFGLLATHQVENAVVQAYWRWLDRRAVKRKSQATWHLVPTDKLRI